MGLNVPERRQRRWMRWSVGIGVVVAVALFGVAAVAGFFDRDPVRLFAARGAKRPVGVLYMSGDMGLRFGPNPTTTRTLAANGVTVVALKSPTLFRFHRTRGEVDRIVADAVRTALARSGASRIVVIGQSYGADILETGLAALPPTLRSRIAGAVLVVPGESVFFRADPSGLGYRGMPDHIGAASLDRLDWLPVTCIYGRDEQDSACPDVHLPHATIIAMPGGHFLDNDRKGLFAHVLTAIRQDVPGAFR